MKKFAFAALGATIVVAALTAGYSSNARSARSGVSPLPSSSCGPVVYKGSGSPDYIVASDLPLQGAIRHQTLQISRAILWELQQKGWYHSFELPDGTLIDGVMPLEWLRERWSIEPCGGLRRRLRT